VAIFSEALQLLKLFSAIVAIYELPTLTFKATVEVSVVPE